MPYTPDLSAPDDQLIDEAMAQLRAANTAKDVELAFRHLTKMLDLAGLLPKSRGRDVEPLPTYAFNNGAVATIHRVGQMTIAHVAQAAEKKIAPVPIPTFDDEGSGLKNQPKISDPAYLQALAVRRGQVNLLVMDTMLELAADIDVDESALAQLNTTMALVGMPLSEISDKVAYIKHCCITNGDELSKLSGLITGNIEEATAAATATFPSDLSGPPAVALEPAVVGGALLASF